MSMSSAVIPVNVTFASVEMSFTSPFVPDPSSVVAPNAPI